MTMEPFVIETDRLVLDLPIPTDRDRVIEYCRDPLFERFLTLPWPYEPRHADFFLETFVPKGWARGNELTWAIRLESGGPLLGIIGWRRDHGDLGFWLGSPHRGYGYMTEATIAVTDRLIRELDLGEVAWECVAGNAASASVARKAGFAYSGEAPTRLAFRDGSHPLSWHGVFGANDDHSPKSGWPA
jgi:RimJ/RimL family protein N-acetyltransferase